MTEDEISSTGQFTSLGASEATPSYQPAVAAPPVAPASAGRQSAARSAIVPEPADPSATAAGVAAKPAKPPTQEDINSAIAAANANLASSGRVLDYRVDAATGISFALIRNSQTGAVLQQIPGADVIALARMLAGWSPGKHMLLDLMA